MLADLCSDEFLDVEALEKKKKHQKKKKTDLRIYISPLNT